MSRRAIADVDAVLDAVAGPVSRSLRGCTAAEVREIADDQRVDRLPAEVEHFLLRAGRGAGRMLVGSDAFYPDLIGVKDGARELLAENGRAPELLDDAVVIQLHQGYQAFWTSTEDGSGVWFCGESGWFGVGDGAEPVLLWRSVADYLSDMAGLPGPARRLG